MKALLLTTLLSISSLASANEVDDIKDMCANTAILAYNIAEEYHHGTTVNQLNDISESRLEISMINVLQDYQLEPVTLAIMYQDVCLDNPYMILDLLYQPK